MLAYTPSGPKPRAYSRVDPSGSTPQISRMHRLKTRSLLLFAALPLLAMGCRSASAPLEPRYIAVHNTMIALGLGQTGAISEGSLAEGGEARFEVELRGGECVMYIALGSRGARDVGLSVVSEGGEEIARDGTHDRQAAAQACPDRDGIYQVVVTMTDGGGEYLLTSYSGVMPSAGPGRRPVGGGGMVAGGGTCGSPIPLAVGETVSGSTASASNQLTGSCLPGGAAPEQVYEISVDEALLLDISIESDYDGALYLMSSCGGGELACNDDDPDTSHSRIRVAVEPGVYYLAVDGYADARGSYTLRVDAQARQSVAQVCGAATPITPGQVVRGDTSTATDDFHALCAGGANSPDDVYQLSVQQPSRLRVRQTSAHDGALHVRSSCEVPSSEIMCNDDYGGTTASVVTGTLQTPGEYFIISDGYGAGGAAGSYEFTAELAPLAGGTAQGDSCGAPMASQTGAVVMDTFEASDDLVGSCGGQGAADVVMRVDIQNRSRFRAQIERAEFPAVMYLRGAQCADANSEVACWSGGAPGMPTPGARPGPQSAPGIDTVLTPGTYHLVIDGRSAADFGAASLQVEVEDLAALERMCRTAPRIVPGRTINGTTSGEANSFQATCAGGANSPDRAYRLRLRRRSRVRARMTTVDFDGALHIRRDCADATTEVACNDDHGGQRESLIETTLDAGTYYVVVDGFAANNAGSYSLEVETSRP